MRKLSELEGVSLGIVWHNRHCTAYRVRRELREAPSSHWRASAGSVYPLLARLEVEGLVASSSDTGDRRGRKRLQVTAEGRRALRKWILAGAHQDPISSVTDPVRSRTFFLDVLSGKQQLRFAKELIVRMEAYLTETKANLATESERDDLYAYLGSLGAMKITEARLEWLRIVLGRLPEQQARGGQLIFANPGGE